jgi:hypothetical protein
LLYALRVIRSKIPKHVPAGLFNTLCPLVTTQGKTIDQCGVQYPLTNGRRLMVNQWKTADNCDIQYYIQYPLTNGRRLMIKQLQIADQLAILYPLTNWQEAGAKPGKNSYSLWNSIHFYQ